MIVIYHASTFVYHRGIRTVKEVKVRSLSSVKTLALVENRIHHAKLLYYVITRETLNFLLEFSFAWHSNKFAYSFSYNTIFLMKPFP